jgi:predicted small metal-binding protein
MTVPADTSFNRAFLSGTVVPVRVIDCDCGHTLSAANDDDLADRVKEHLAEDHPDQKMSDDEVRAFVGNKAYDASDS